MPSSIIELRNISKIFGTTLRTQVLFDVNLKIEEGSFCSIIGQSGSGKSTLLNILGTLDKPSAGEVYIGGRRTDAMSLDELAVLRNKTLGFIFQFHYLLPEFTALENILMPYRIMHGQATVEAVARANELVGLVGLDKVKHNLSSQMSGGQQQRTAIARAIMNNPKIILADEPTGNLDSDNTESMYALLRNINRIFNTTVVVITHDRRIAEKADRIIEIKDGRVGMDI